jgi:hypothetical protein
MANEKRILLLIWLRQGHLVWLQGVPRVRE